MLPHWPANTKTKLVVSDDAHAPGSLVGLEMRRKIALGIAGLTIEEYAQVRAEFPALVQENRAKRS
ncbi:hypothetical protein [Maridesulfovibrio sp.]|uniref:hypothetical protein n=1 Tax=Maridesulfovibrio sp. TaxID=2795000 RepID=UPI003AFF9A81